MDPAELAGSTLGPQYPLPTWPGAAAGAEQGSKSARWQCEVPRKETEVECSRRWGNHQKDPKPGSKLCLLGGGMRIPAFPSQFKEGRTGYKLCVPELWVGPPARPRTRWPPIAIPSPNLSF